MTSKVTCTEEAPLVRNRCEIHCFVMKIPNSQLCPGQNDVQRAGSMQTISHNSQSNFFTVYIHLVDGVHTACIQHDRLSNMMGVHRLSNMMGVHRLSNMMGVRP